MTGLSVWLLFAVLTYSGNFPQHINTPTYYSMHYHILNTFAGLSAFGLSWASHLTILCDWRQTAAVVACDVASVRHVTGFVSLSYVWNVNYCIQMGKFIVIKMQKKR